MNRLDEAMLRSAAPAHGAAAAVKKADAYAGLPADADQRRLRAVQRPEAGQNPAVLVAVAVADHHLLHEVIAAALAPLFLQAPHGHRMLEEGAQDVRAAREVVDRLEQRHDRQAAGQTVRRADREADFASEQVGDEQVGQAARHADDQRAETFGPATARGARPASGRCAAPRRLRAAGPRPGASRHVGAQKRPRRRELAVQEIEPAWFVPVLVVGLVESGGRQQLRHREIVEAAVLADVERGQMKSERLHAADDRPDRLVGQAPGADRDERFVQQLKIGEQLVGVLDIVRDRAAIVRLPDRRFRAAAARASRSTSCRQVSSGLLRISCCPRSPSSAASCRTRSLSAAGGCCSAIGEARLPGQTPPADAAAAAGRAAASRRASDASPAR